MESGLETVIDRRLFCIQLHQAAFAAKTRGGVESRHSEAVCRNDTCNAEAAARPVRRTGRKIGLPSSLVI
jgi:hypothetical protein